MRKIIIENKNLFLLALAFCILVGAYLVFGKQKQEEYIPFVSTTKVETRNIDDEYILPAVAKPEKELDIAGEIGGKIEILNADVGDRISEGEILGTIDNKVNSATNAGLGNAISKIGNLFSNTENMYDDRIKSADENLSLIKNATSSNTKASNALTNSVILSNQVNDTLGEILTIKNGVRKYKYSYLYEHLGETSSGTREEAENATYNFQMKQKELQNFYNENILNKQATPEQIATANTMSQEVLTLAKLALEKTYTAFRFTLASGDISETQLTEYKNSISTLGTNVENTIANLQGSKSEIVQAELGLSTLQKEKSVKLSEIYEKLAEIETNKLVNEAMLDSGNISSSLEGVITKKYAEIGSIVNSGTPIFHLVQDDILKVIIDVPENISNKIYTGQNIFIYFKNSEKVDATIKKVYPTLNEINNKLTIEIEIENYDHKILAGSLVRVAIPKNIKEKTEKLALIKDAVVSRYGINYVFVLENNLAKKRIVELGASNDLFVEILKGLNKDEKVIPSGVEYLRDGDKVNFSN